MSWPFYLARKHLFPTGRGLTVHGVGRALRHALIIATVLFAILVCFMWWRGVFSQILTPRLDVIPPTKMELAGDMGLVWLWFVVVFFTIMFIFRCTPFFNAMSIFGITLGVTVLITVQSVMNGFAQKYAEVFIETQGNIVIYSPTQGIVDDAPAVAALALKVPGVKYAEPVGYGDVMLVSDNHYSPTTVRSFDLNGPYAAHDPLATKVEWGKFDDLDDQSVLLGRHQAEMLNANVGSKVDAYSFTMLDKIKRDNVPMPKELTVVGIFDTGYALYDGKTIAVTAHNFEDFSGYPAAATVVEVRLDNDDLGHTYDVQAALEQALLPLNKARVAAHRPETQLEVENWKERNKDQMDILNVEKSMMFYIMIVIVIVAAFCILCSLATSVVRKTREIGVLGALGARPRQVAAVFCLQGLIIGAVGAMLGVALSLMMLHYRESIMNVFVDPSLREEFYNVYAFPIQYRAWDFANILGFTFFISTLAGLLPAWWAARLKPADCLRYE
jgi:lipoprotein-releasing system permease protein